MKLRNINIAFLFAALIFCNSCSDHNPVSYKIDQWQTSSPEDQNINSLYLNKLVLDINDNIFGNIKSLVIIRNSYLIFEKYFRGDTRETLHPVYSVTKSIVSALVGILFQRDEISSLDNKLLSYFADYNIKNPDTDKSSITLRHTLNMSAGFQWNELSIPYSDPNNDFQKLFSSSDPIQYVLDKPMQDTPGSIFRYNTGLPLLFGAIITELTGEPADTFANKNLFSEIGIRNFNWVHAQGNIVNTGSGLYLRPLDMALFGELYLNQGIWNRKQIISPEWISLSTAKSIVVNSNFDYGYYWWRYSNSNNVVSTLPINDIYYAYGYGDQIILIIPQYKIVVVITADNGESNYPIDNIFKNYILPSIIDK
jgi:CubicO group peptidase (beta-lactamase class C family)